MDCKAMGATVSNNAASQELANLILQNKVVQEILQGDRQESEEHSASFIALCGNWKDHWSCPLCMCKVDKEHILTPIVVKLKQVEKSKSTNINCLMIWQKIKKTNIWSIVFIFYAWWQTIGSEGACNDFGNVLSILDLTTQALPKQTAPKSHSSAW